MHAFGIQIHEDMVHVCPSGMTKQTVLDALIGLVGHVPGVVTDQEAFRRAVFEREAVMSTGIGSGVAIPHVRTDAVKVASLVVGISAEGIDFDTLDNALVHVIVLFAMPAGSQKEYLRLLAQVMQSLKIPGFRDRLMQCSTAAEIVTYLNEFEK